MKDISQIIDEKITRKLRRRTSDKPHKARLIFGSICILAGIGMKFMSLLGDWPSIVLAVLGGVLITDESIANTISSWKGKK